MQQFIKPGLRLPKLRLGWYLIAIFLATILAVGLVVWRSYNQAPVAEAAINTPTVRGTSSGIVRYNVSPKTISRPTTQSGDVLLLFLATDWGNYYDVTLPAGFTEVKVRAYATDRLAYRVAYKIAGGSEPSSYSFTAPEWADAMYSLSSVQNADTTAPILESNDFTGEASPSGGDNTHSVPDIMPGGGQDLLFSTVALDSVIPNDLGQNTWTTAAGMTKIAEQQVSDASPARYMMSMIVATQNLNSPGNTGVKTFRSQSTSPNPGFGFNVAIKGNSDAKTPVTPDTIVSNSWATSSTSAISEVDSLNTSTINSGTGSGTLSTRYGFSNLSNALTATAVEFRVCAYSATNANGSNLDNLEIIPRIEGVNRPTITVTPPYTTSPTACTWYSQTYTGFWTPTQLDNLEVIFNRVPQGSKGNSSGYPDDIRVNSAYVRITNQVVVSGSTTAYTAPSVRAYTSANHTSAVSSKTITRPTVQSGDLLVAVFAADKGRMREMIMPSGFTEVAWLDRGLGGIHTKIATKVATGSEPASYSYSASSDSNTRFDMIAVQNADTSANPVISRYMTPVAQSNFNVPSVEPAGANDLLLMALARTSSPTTGAMSWLSETGAGISLMGMTQSSNVLSLMTAQKSLTNGVSTPRYQFTSSDASGGGAVGYSQPTVKLATADVSSEPKVSLSVARPYSSMGGIQLAQASTLSSESATAFSMAIKGITQPVVEQANYRFYASQDNATGGSPLAANNTPASLPAQTPFRLRQLVRQIDGSTPAATSFKLQAAEKSGSCSASTFSDGLAQFYDISSITDEQSLTSRTDDPTVSGGSIINQRVSEDAATTTLNSIASGNSGLWEFSLNSPSGWAGKTYCFRMVKSDGSALSSYAQYPEISFTTPELSTGPTLDQQLRGGQSVVNGEKKPYSW